MIRCIIVDDELPARAELKYILSKSPKVSVVGEASYGREAIDLNNELKPDLILLDIQMPQMNGIDVAKELIKGEHIPIIIFITAYDSFALEAFEVNAVDYLLKPLSEDRLLKRIEKIESMKDNTNTYSLESIDRLIKQMKSASPARLAVYYNNKLIPIDTKDIIYITIEAKNTMIVTTNGRYQANNTLNELYSKLDSHMFFRSHKSYILNLNFIESIEPWFNATYNINLKHSKDVVPVSRKYAKIFKETMNIE